MNFSSLQKSKWIRIGLITLLLSLISIWLIETPPGLDGKLHAIGFAACHQIESHTLELGGKLLPLCARCTGMFMGALVAFLVLSSQKKPSGSPSRAKIIVLAVLFLVFLMDGINSVIATFLKTTPLYPPSNLIRLATGLIMGMILVNLILPLMNQTLWKTSNPEAVLKSWKQLAFLLLCEAVMGGLIWLDLPLSYYPVAILSIGTIFLILGIVYSLLWSIILNKENTLEKFSQGWTIYLLGIISAFLQIGLMNLLRVSITGSWGGFQL